MAVHGLELDQVGCAAGAVWWKLVRFDSPLAFPSQHFQTPFKRPVTSDYHATPSDYPFKQVAYSAVSCRAIALAVNIRSDKADFRASTPGF